MSEAGSRRAAGRSRQCLACRFWEVTGPIHRRGRQSRGHATESLKRIRVGVRYVKGHPASGELTLIWLVAQSVMGYDRYGGSLAF